jgi:predicted permease
LRSPGFTIVAALTLALGIGANTAVFSVVNGFLLRPLPGKDNDKLVVVGIRHPGGESAHGLSYLDFRDYRAQAESFADMAAYANGFVGLTADNRSERILVQFLTGNFFSMLGLQPAAGRFFYPGEGEQSGTEPLLVLGHAYWQKRFGGDPSVIGKGVIVNGKAFTIVGVAPKDLIGPYTPIETDAYIPLGMSSGGEYPDMFTNRAAHNLHVLARPKPGAKWSEARTSVQVVARRLEQEYPATNKGITVDIYPERLARPEPDGAEGNPVGAAVFLAMVGLVLLVTCVNVANLLLVRASARFKEMAIRAALGAGRVRIFRQLLTESLLLSMVGGTGGALLGWWFSRLIGSIRFPVSFPMHVDLSFDWRVFGYVGLIAALCGILVGLAPAWRASRMNLSSALREGGRSSGAGASHNRMRNALVVFQVAGTLVVLITAGLFVRSLQSVEKMDLGFRAEGLLNLVMDPKQLGYDEERGAAFYRALKERVQALPGVESASLAFAVPMGYYNQSGRVWIEGQAGVPESEVPAISYNMADEDYFLTMQMPLRRGRAIGKQDQKDSPRVAVINETMARQLWPGQDPIGHHFSYEKSDAPPVEVVGVAKDGKYNWVLEDQQAYFYVPLAQSYSSLRVLHVRSSMAPLGLAPTIEREIHNLEPNLPVFDVGTMQQSLGGANGFFLVRMGAMFAAILGGLGLLLAVVGVYGVVSYAVSLRTHEFGIRIALGAQGKDIWRMVLRQGLALVGIGLAIGLALSLGLTRVLKSLLFQVSTLDPVTFLLVSVLLAGVSLVACYLPARRATKVDPLVALRYE